MSDSPAKPSQPAQPSQGKAKSSTSDASAAQAQPKSTKTSTLPRIPSRVQDKLAKLRQLETRLGHLPPDEISLTELHERVADPQFEFHASQLEQQTELLFGDICDELLEAGLSPEQISAAINAKLRYEGGPAYCNESEVRECLGLKD